MFDSIRRHQKWLWIVISGLTIISFVWYFNPRSMRGGYGGGWRGNETVGSIYGHPVSRQDYLDVYQEARLRYFLSYQHWPGNDDLSRQMVEREARHRLLLIEKLLEINLQVSDAAVAQWIAEAFRDPEQKVFRKEAYDRFVKEALPNQQLRVTDFERFVRHEVGIQHLVAVAGVSGRLVTPQEAEAVYRRENEAVEAEAVFFVSSNFLANATVDAAAVAQFYTNQASLYRVPERAQVAYVKFEATNYLAEADQRMAQDTNLNLRLERLYQERGANFFKDTNDMILPAAAAKEKIKGEMHQAYAVLAARKQAIEFATELLELQPKQPDNIDRLAAAKGFPSKATEPFTRDDGPAGLKVPDDFNRIAFALTGEEPFGEQPVVAEDGVYVLGLKKRLPSELPPVENIREKVTEDYRKNQALNLARAAGQSFHGTLTNQLAQGRAFHAICQEANVKPIKLNPFSPNTQILPDLPNRGDLSLIKNAAFALSIGEISPFVQTRNGGFVLQLQARLPVPEARVQAELPSFLTTLRRSRQAEAFQQWFRKQTELARVNLPGEKDDEDSP